MTNTFSLGVDLGGTKMALALVDANGHLIREGLLPTQPQDGPQMVISRLAEAIRGILTESNVPIAGVGVGVPGHVQNGVVLFNSNLGWRDVPLQAELEHALQVPVKIENDVRALAAGEARWGHGAGLGTMFYLAVGTGLGGAAVINGQLWAGETGFSMEVGHLPWPGNTRRCGCDKIGCVETMLSGLGLLQGVRVHRLAYPNSPLTHAEDVTTADILAAAHENDPLALHVLREARETLVIVGAWGVGLLNAQAIVIGGGMAKAAHDLWWPNLEDDIRAHLLPGVKDFKLYAASLAQTAVGAASLIV